MGDTVSYSNMDMENNLDLYTLGGLKALLICAILLPGSCLHLFTSTFNLWTQNGNKKWHPKPQILIPSFISIKVNTTLHDPGILYRKNKQLLS